MRVVLINETYGIGSTGKLVKELSLGLKQNDIQVKCYSAVYKSDDNSCMPISNYFDQKIHAILSRITGLQGYYSSLCTRKLLKDLDLYKPDIIHLHNLHGNYINLKLLLDYCKKNNIIVCLTLHDCWFFTGKCTHYISVKCEKWRDLCGECPLLHVDNVNPTFFFDRTKKCLNDKKEWFSKIQTLGVIGVSEWIANEASKSLFKEISTITVINNWIDTNVFKPIDNGLRKSMELIDKKIVLMVTSFVSSTKGYNEMLYLSKNLNSDYRIILIGNNPDNLFIPDNVIHIKRTENQFELAEFYSMSDVCVNTTKCETFGLVTVESIACGTPVIVYNNTASRYIVTEDVGVTIDESKGYDNLLKAIYNIVDSKHYNTEIMQEYVNNNFSLNTGIDRHISFYQTLIERRDCNE